VKATYDIFRRLPDGAPIWIETAQSLDLVKTRLAALTEIQPADYIVYDLSQNQVLVLGCEHTPTGVPLIAKSTESGRSN
jgi:hypothetical protein